MEPSADVEVSDTGVRMGDATEQAERLVQD
jgi:hypothetical protein